MTRTRSLVVLSAVWFIAACGGGQEAKEPPDCRMLSTGCGDASAATGDAGAGALPTSGGGEVDAGAGPSAAQTPDAGAQAAAADAGKAPDDMDKAVSVCGDEAMPVEKRVRPKIKACFFEAKAKDPALDGHVRITFVIDDKGKIKKTEIAQSKQLGAAATACMMKALKESKLDAAHCPGKTVGFEQAFGHAAKD